MTLVVWALVVGWATAALAAAAIHFQLEFMLPFIMAGIFTTIGLAASIE